MDFYLNRNICGVLDEMRSLNKVRNYSSFLALIEEAQMMANKMEAALDDQKDVKRATERLSQLKQEIKNLEGKIEKLKFMKKGMK